MRQNIVKKNIHKMVDMINDINYLKSVENILAQKANSNAFELSEDELQILEKRSADYRRNNKGLMTWEEAKIKILSKNRKR